MDNIKISYNISKNNIENIDDVKLAFNNLINTYISAMGDITLKDIVITDAIYEDVINFQQKHNLMVVVSKNCYGKFISYIENKENEGIIFYDWTVIYAISNIENKSFFHSVIIHELFHAQENYITSFLYDFNSDNEEKYREHHKNLDYNLNIICNIIWSEYYAIRNTAQCLKLYETNFDIINEWLKLLNNKFKNILKLMNVYNTNDKYKFFNGLIENTLEFFKTFSYICGNIYNPSDNEEIKKSKFKYMIERLNDEFKRLFELYPNWNGLDEYNNLQNIIIKFWNYYGIKINQNKDELEIIIKKFSSTN